MRSSPKRCAWRATCRWHADWAPRRARQPSRSPGTALPGTSKRYFSMSQLHFALDFIQRWDRRLCVRLNGTLRFRPVLHGFRAISWLGDGIFWYSLMLALLLTYGRDAAFAVVHLVITGIACTLTYKIVKKSTLRPRPYEVMSVVARGAAPLDAFSFPSGHTLHAVAFTLVATAYYPWLAVLLAPFTLLVAASRVILGLHYPSDVLAGALIGATIAYASFAIA